MAGTTLAANAGVLPSPLQVLRSQPKLCPLATLALQIQHHLQHQHQWSHLQIVTHSPVTGLPLPRPLIAGLPHQRLYVHPDEQIERLKEAAKRTKSVGKGGQRPDKEDGGLDMQLQPELEWVLPTRLNEKWTLGRLSAVFDQVSVMPPAPPNGQEEAPLNPWRKTKRLVLATVDSDSTVVCYIIHDGIVKPRQN